MFSSSIDRDPFTHLQYCGLPGISGSCLKAVQRFVQFGDHIQSATILTHENAHAIALVINEGETIIIKNGFSSGYRGEGPSCLAKALAILDAYSAEIDEVVISKRQMTRIEGSALSQSDWQAIQSAEPIRPIRWHDYIYDAVGERFDKQSALLLLPEVMPWNALDPRCIDLALQYRSQPDEALSKGFRRFEDIVRARTESKEIGSRLISQAFVQDASRLTWEDIDPAEIKGRGQILSGTFMAFRNPRAHQEHAPHLGLSELLALNLLYLLEAKANERPENDCKSIESGRG